MTVCNIGDEIIKDTVTSESLSFKHNVCSGGSQLSCPKDTQAAQWRGPWGLQHSHVSEVLKEADPSATVKPADAYSPG